MAEPNDFSRKKWQLTYQPTIKRVFYDIKQNPENSVIANKRG